MLGVYSFGMGLTGYLAGLAQRRQPNLIFYNLLITGVGLFLFEFINYGINRLFKLINIDLKFALTHYMLPSVLFNLLIALICYVPIRKLLEGKRIAKSGNED
jgi:rod shape-determining protein MreD